MARSRWVTAAYLPALAADLPIALTLARGATPVELLASATERPLADLEALADAGVVVACASLVSGPALTSPAVEIRRAALDLLRRAVSDAARLGALVVALEGFPATAADRALFSEAAELLANHAWGRMVRVAVGGEQPEDILAWLAEVNHPGLGLLLAGRQVESGLVRGAGSRLLHLRLEESQLQGLAPLLDEIGYSGAVSLLG